MPNTIKDAELHVVVQFGGSSKEQYLHSFTNEEAANDYIRNAADASYRCIGPFTVRVPGVRQLAEASKEILARLDSEGLYATLPAKELATALAELEREFPLN